MMTSPALLAAFAASAAMLAGVPTSEAASAGTPIVLHAFAGGTDGATPLGGLIADRAGALIGTTSKGGSTFCAGAGCGTIFRLVPPAVAGGAWTEQIMARFAGGSDGAVPDQGFVADAAGNLYSSTAQGGGAGCGGNGCGTVFRLIPPPPGKHAWRRETIYRFGGGSDGGVPVSGITIGPDGALYGATSQGGGMGCGGIGCGTVFRLARPTAAHPAWSETVRHAFAGGSDGAVPAAGAVTFIGTTLYGATPQGGGHFCPGPGFGCGTLYAIDPARAGSYAVLWSFAAGADNAQPMSGLLPGPAGTLFGVTDYVQGSGHRASTGTVFQFTPPTPASPASLTTLWSFFPFSAGGDGGTPNPGLVADASGALYGLTFAGGNQSIPCTGAGGCGVAFKLAPPTQVAPYWTESVVSRFVGSTDSGEPNAGPLALGGALYAMASALYTNFNTGQLGAVVQIAP